jgi:hypothetical protein
MQGMEGSGHLRVCVNLLVRNARWEGESEI